LITSVDGFADTRLKWTPKQGAKIPPTYTVHLTRAVLIGGLVVDYENKPVAGALVGFNHQADPASAIQLENHEFGWIEVETGPDGRWRINRMAEEILPGIYGSARHPDYVASEMAFVEHDLALLKQFRAQTHVFQLGQGLTLQGLVVDTRGQPIREAKVRVGHISESGKREAKTKEDGTFVIAGNKAGRNLVSAEADGFAPATKKVDINETTDPVRIELAPGNRLRLRLVNNEGMGIPKAQIWYSTFERRTQSSDDSSIPIQLDFSPRTDGEGRAVWENAPEGNLSFSFEASGYMRRDDVIVHSDDEEHSITLDKALTLTGTVRDENTGKLIQDFRIICGWPEGGYGPGVRWSTIDRFWLKFSGGVYRHSFEEPVVGGSSKAQFVFKFEADGYTPFQTRVFDANEGDTSLDVTLKPGSAPLVTVLSPDGNPVIGADIGLMAPGAGLRLTPGGFSKNSAGGGTLLKTDKEGRFQFTLEETIRQVVVASEQGYAAATPESLVADPNIRLQPWGRLEVSCRRGEKAVVGREYTLEFPGERNEEIGFDFQTFKQTGDSAGRLAFGMVPPGKLKLMRLIRQDQPGGVTAWGHGDKTDVEIRPGETTQITIGGAGYLVRGRVIFPGTQRPLEWKAFASVHTPYPKPPPTAILQDKEALMAYTSRPEFLELRRSAKNYTVEVHDDGTFISDDIAAGTYLLSVGIVSAGRVAFNSENSLSIPADPVTGVIDLGEIPLRPGLEDHP
jgi:protocatechuate 3,4-dioxygenase beta subunit